MIRLRPQDTADLPLLGGGESPFDDFGPESPRTEPRSASLEEQGGLTVLDGDGQVAGTVSWIWMQWGPNRGSRCPMIGIWMRPEFRGRGLGRAAQAELVELFFRHTTANRVEAHTDVENVAEQRALEAVGFRREGVTRGAQWRDGAFHDGILYAVLRDDPGRPAVTTVLTTERLTLRRFTDADEDLLVALHSDPAVMRYLGPPATRDEIREQTLPYYLGLNATAFGYWAAIETATGEFLGWFLFRPPRVDPEPGTIELGYRLHTAAWGRGFATEGARALVDTGFAELGAERVVADTMAVNTGSRNVMEKVGLRFVRVHHEQWDEPLDGAEHGEVFYELTRSEWSRASRAAGPGPGAATPPR